MIVSDYSFEGPYEVGKKVVDRTVVYVILDADNNIIDVGQSGEAGTRLLVHDRKSCWDRYGGRWFAVKWMSSNKYDREDRENLEREIRNQEMPPCGKE